MPDEKASHVQKCKDEKEKLALLVMELMIPSAYFQDKHEEVVGTDVAIEVVDIVLYST